MASAPVVKDEVFKAPLKSVADFAFGEKVASVFDDMLLRSVPFYEEMQRMIAELSADFAVEGTNVYDLGCSTGTTMLHLASKLPQNVKFIGVDNSEDMLKKCRQKLAENNFQRDHELLCADFAAPGQRADLEILLHGELGENFASLRHIADAEAGAVLFLQALDRMALELDAALLDRQ